MLQSVTLNSFWKCFRILRFIKIFILDSIHLFLTCQQKQTNEKSLKTTKILMYLRILKHFQRLLLAQRSFVLIMWCRRRFMDDLFIFACSFSALTVVVHNTMLSVCFEKLCISSRCFLIPLRSYNVFLLWDRVESTLVNAFLLWGQICINFDYLGYPQSRSQKCKSTLGIYSVEIFYPGIQSRKALYDRSKNAIVNI